METVAEVKAHCEWLIAHGRAGEAAKLFMPKVENQRRRANKEGYHRFTIEVGSMYGEFHAMKDRLITLCFNNPPLAYAILLDLIKAVPDEIIVGMAQGDQVENAGEQT